MQEENSQYNIPQWLKDIQENSWELELLISGGAIFSLFQLSDLFMDFTFSLKMTSNLQGTDLFVIFGMMGIKLLTIGFITHLILRSFWIGLVCLNYVYPEGISNKKSFLKRPFKNVHQHGENLFADIIKIDRASGLVMFISMLTTMLIVGFALLIIVLISLPSLFINIELFYIKIAVSLILIYYLDLVSFGILRKIPGLTYVTFPFFKLFDFVTLRFAYQRSLRLFNSNVSRIKALGIFSFMILVAFFMTYATVYRVMHWKNIFDTREHRWNMADQTNWISHTKYIDLAESKNTKLNGPAIQSEIIKDNFLKIYIPYHKDYDDDIDQPGKYLSDYLEISINDSTYQNLEWYNYSSSENNQLGLRCYIDIKHLPRGEYEVKIASKSNQNRFEIIPFWKDVN